MSVDPVKFNKPPVVEVACGILFSNTELLKTIHVGEFWELIKNEFPNVEDVAPIEPIVELSGEQLQNIQPAMSFAHMPPLRRTWFISEDGTNLIQLQGDRFLFNRKRAQQDDQYPSYEKVMLKFEHWLSIFEKFCRDTNLPTFEYRQFEMVYVNHITKSNGLNILTGDNVFTDHIRDDTRDRFLPSPSIINWTSSYDLPEDCGRLHIVMQSALILKPEKQNMFRLDLTARGIPKNVDSNSRKKWFEMAHEWITKGFADSTNNELHLNNCWDRKS